MQKYSLERSEDFWPETQAKPIEMFLIVHLWVDFCDRTRIQGLKCLAICLKEKFYSCSTGNSGSIIDLC
jgi:hypothetical protein